MSAETDRVEAVKLAKEYRPSMDREVLHSWAADAVKALRDQQAEIERTPNVIESLTDIHRSLQDQLETMQLRAEQAEAEVLKLRHWKECAERGLAERDAQLSAMQAAMDNIDYILTLDACPKAIRREIAPFIKGEAE